MAVYPGRESDSAAREAALRFDGGGCHGSARGGTGRREQSLRQPEDTVSIVSKSDCTNGTTLRLGLLFRLSKGWHIYWKNAGDAGSPPQLALTRPAGTTVGAFAWPAPEWLVTNALGDYVVNGTVLLPFTVSLPQAVSAQGVDLGGNAHWLVCSAVICVPQQASFSLHLPQGTASPSAGGWTIRVGAEAEPGPSPFASSISASGVLTVTGQGLGSANVQNAHFFPDRPDAIVNAAPQKLDVHPDGFSLALKPLKWSPQATTHRRSRNNRQGREQAGPDDHPGAVRPNPSCRPPLSYGQRSARCWAACCST